MLMNLKFLLLLPVWVLAHGVCGAQGVLRDPTTPPAGVPLPANHAQAVGDTAGSQMPPQQSVIRIIPVEGRKQVVVDGRTLQTGGQIGQWRLVSITANSVMFKDSHGMHSVPTLQSSISKTPVPGPAVEQ